MPSPRPQPHARPFGTIRQLPSGRWQIRYRGPDGQRHTGERTYASDRDSKGRSKATPPKAAVAALAAIEREIDLAEYHGETWQPPKDRRRAEAAALASARPFGLYAEEWLAARTLRPRVRVEYRRLLDRLILPTFGTTPLPDLRPHMVRSWHAGLDLRKPTRNAHAYGLLRTICSTAVTDELLDANPCRIRGAGSTQRKRDVRVVSDDQLGLMLEHMPDRFRSLLLVTAWCALRIGESTALRRGDVDLEAGVLHVRRGVVRVDGGFVFGKPKTQAGERDVFMPPPLTAVLAEHVAARVSDDAEALLWPAADGKTALAPTTLYRHFYKARDAAGLGPVDDRPGLAWHHLRHTGAVLAAQEGASLKELMSRLGHSSPAAALRYQHVAEGRDAELARRLGDRMARHRSAD